MRELPGPVTADIDLPTVLHALSDPVRLEIVACLRDGEAPCGDLVSDRVAKSTKSHHMRVLREAGVITTRAEGTFKLSSLRRDDLDSRFPGLLDAVLAAAPQASRTS